MDRKESRQDRVAQVARELGATLRRQARGRWKDVRTADRNEPGRHVWRFVEGDGSARFLHVEHGAMTRGSNASSRLMSQLESEKWLDRLSQGPEQALLLSSDGRLSAYTAL
jgi:hypothetical protein